MRLPRSFGLLFVCGVFLGAVSPGRAQVSRLVGYTRPGNPPESIRDGKVIFVGDPGSKENALGGSIYFMVLERGNAGEEDPWNAGIPNLASAFRAGVDSGGTTSPTLRTTARYLYLYQVVNDRKVLNPRSIADMSVGLLVEPRDISSWGWFDGLGFATEEPAEERKDERLRFVSFSHILKETALAEAYRDPAPFGAIRRPLVLGRLTSSRKEGGKIVQVTWDLLNPPQAPDFVMLLAPTRAEDQGSFRAIWSGKNLLGREARSTVFGFTSDLPPKLETAGLLTGGEGGRNNPIKQAAGLDWKVVLAQEPPPPGMKPPPLTARGTVPTPAPPGGGFDGQAGPPPFLAPPTGEPGVLFVGNAGGFGGGGFGPTAGIGGTAFARAPFIGGGGGAGSGSGGGGGQGTGSTEQKEAVAIDFDVRLENRQSQQQQQVQAQAQAQAQVNINQGSGHGGPVIPAPASLVLAGTGLVGFWLAGRRKRKKA